MPHSSRENLKTIGFAVIITLAVALVYLKAAPGGFVWDDVPLVRDNLYVRRIENVKLLFSKKYFAAFNELSYRPVCTLTYLIDYQIWGAEPGGHITNTVLHLLNSLLLYFFVLRLYGRHRAAFGAAGLFALHPVQTEAVAGITFREDLLCLLFVLAAAHFYLSWREGGGRWKIPMLVSFALALLSKETAVVLPAAIVAMELSPPLSTRVRRAGWSGAAALWVCAGAYLALRFFVFKGPSEVYPGGGGWETAKLSLAAFQRYLELIELKFHQCVIYPPEAILNFDAPSWALAGVHAVLIAACLIFFKRSAAAWGMAWFILFLLPVSNIVPIAVVMADRYLYIPLAGLATAFALIVERIVEGGAEKPRPARAIAYLAAMLLLMFVFFTRAQNRCYVWLDEVNLWQSAASCAPGSAYAHNNLGKAFYDQLNPRYGLAERELQKAVALASRTPLERDRYRVLPRAHANLGIVYALTGRPDAARSALDESLSLWPGNPNALLNRGVLNMTEGRFGEAVGDFETALRAEPGNAQARVYLAILYLEFGRVEDAMRECETVLRIHPEHPGAMRVMRAIEETVGSR